MAIGAHFRSARLCLIGADGEFVDAGGRSHDPRGAMWLVASRAHCRFHLFRAPEGLSGRAAERAAQLHAEMRAPFAEADTLLLRQANGIAIWWWDAAGLKAAIGGRWRYDAARILPETTQYPIMGAGWRQVALHDGYEAQYWEDGALAASAWRRRPFDADAWAAFVLSVDGAVRTDGPPLPEKLPLPESVHRPAGRISAGGGLTLEKVAAGFALAALGVGGWYSGQALRYDRIAAEQQAEADAIESVMRRDAALGRKLGELATIRAFARESTGPDVAGAAARAFEIFAERELRVGDWRIDGERFRATVVQDDQLGRVRDAVALMEEDPLFTAALARSDGRDGAVTVEAGLVAR